MDEIKAMLEKIGAVVDNVNVDAVFGKPETTGERVLIPVAEIAYGFGVGFGTASPQCYHKEEACSCHEADEDEKEACDAGAEEHSCCGEGEAGAAGAGGGGGAGGRARPIAYIEVGPDGTKVEPIMDEQKIALAGILLGAWAVGWIGLVLKTLFQTLTSKK
ncbi:MAG TPA: spore germination protein GerW family protein [Anaerolineae bacterium]|nr:spore germination protein GerW family protein [Anaerolineae bacterium]HQH37418.1 spore germination protein GerW family protein [Anaerolineae bacterium]